MLASKANFAPRSLFFLKFNQQNFNGQINFYELNFSFFRAENDIRNYFAIKWFFGKSQGLNGYNKRIFDLGKEALIGSIHFARGVNVAQFASVETDFVITTLEILS